MLIATITALILIFSGGGAAAIGAFLALTGDRIEEHVDGPERVAAADAELEAMRVELERFVEEGEACRVLLVEIDSDYDATREDYAAAAAKIEANWDRFEDTLLDFRFALRDLLRREEWQKVFPPL